MPNYRIIYNSADTVLASGEFDNDRDAITWAHEAPYARGPRLLKCVVESQAADGSWPLRHLLVRNVYDDRKPILVSTASEF